MGLRLDSPPFNLLYTNIKAKANNSASKPSLGPRRRPATHGLDVVVIFGYKGFPINFIFSGERLLVNFVLIVATKDDQIRPRRSGVNKRDGDKIGHSSRR
jgi:hypothetical protein